MVKSYSGESIMQYDKRQDNLHECVENLIKSEYNYIKVPALEVCY